MQNIKQFQFTNKCYRGTEKYEFLCRTRGCLADLMISVARRRADTRMARQENTASQAREDPEVSFLYFRSAGSGTFRVVVLGKYSQYKEIQRVR